MWQSYLTETFFLRGAAISAALHRLARRLPTSSLRQDLLEAIKGVTHAAMRFGPGDEPRREGVRAIARVEYLLTLVRELGLLHSAACAMLLTELERCVADIVLANIDGGASPPKRGKMEHVEMHRLRT